MGSDLASAEYFARGECEPTTLATLSILRKLEARAVKGAARMEAVMTRWMIVMSLAACSLVGCKDDVHCERQRLDLDKMWSQLREAATHRKLEGVDVPSWTDIETKAELLESSFLTQQVTWDSADKASQAIAAKLPAMQAENNAQLIGFRTSAESAIKQQSSFEKECR